jgi:hypothetical protein
MFALLSAISTLLFAIFIPWLNSKANSTASCVERTFCPATFIKSKRKQH